MRVCYQRGLPRLVILVLLFISQGHIKPQILAAVHLLVELVDACPGLKMYKEGVWERRQVGFTYFNLIYILYSLIKGTGEKQVLPWPRSVGSAMTIRHPFGFFFLFLGYLAMTRSENKLPCGQYTSHPQYFYKFWTPIKLDGVGSVDNRPSTNKLHHFVKKRRKKNL